MLKSKMFVYTYKIQTVKWLVSKLGLCKKQNMHNRIPSLFEYQMYIKKNQQTKTFYTSYAICHVLM